MACTCRLLQTPAPNPTYLAGYRSGIGVREEQVLSRLACVPITFGELAECFYERYRASGGAHVKDPFAGKCRRNHMLSVTFFFNQSDKIRF